MGEGMTTSELIKIILGVLVIVVAVIAIGIFFGDKIIGFFKNLPGGDASIKILIGLLI